MGLDEHFYLLLEAHPLTPLYMEWTGAVIRTIYTTGSALVLDH